MLTPFLLKGLTKEQKLRVLAMDFVGGIVGILNLEPMGITPFIEQVADFLEDGEYELEEEASGEVKTFPRPVKD